MMSPMMRSEDPAGRRRSPATTPLRCDHDEPVDPDRDAKAGLAFFMILILYGQLLTYGFWSRDRRGGGVVSRVIEILLATIRRATVGGKVIGLGSSGSGSC